MSDKNSDRKLLGRLVSALGDYAEEVVFIGGWAHRLYALTAEGCPKAKCRLARYLGSRQKATSALRLRLR